ncbi:MAG: ParB/RepB/Spo0J family partition protein [Candidatus Lokiarchaeota archaeon]|nr:ParB/RepB/Spo0J family partition protein [Candidatus Lokiarchaeota archaeon]
MLEEKFDDFFEVAKVNIRQIKCDERDRIRTTSGKNIEDLKASIEELDLFHPITINNEYKLIAGYRRLLACKELGWEKIPAIIRNNTTELEELCIELQENIRRKDLTPYEIDIALAKWKRIYETLYPQTKYLAHVKSGKRDEKGRIQKRHQALDSAICKSDEIKKIPRFTKVASKQSNLSERTIRDRVQVGESILNGLYDKHTTNLYKDGQISHSKMIKLKQKIANRKNKDFKDDTSDQRMKSKIKEVSEENKNFSKQAENCINCKRATIVHCPECGKNVVICLRKNPRLKKLISSKCNYFLDV